MKKIFSTLLILLAIQVQAAPEPLDRLIAIVNDTAITELELQRELDNVKRQLRSQGRTVPPDEANLTQQVLDRLVLKHIQQQLAKRSNVIIDDEALNRAINRIAEQNQLTLAQFREVLLNDGYDFNLFREDIRFEILQNRLRQRFVENRINITEAEVDDFISQQQKQGSSEDEYQLGHILISTPEGAGPEQIQQAKTKIQTLLNNIRAGAVFSQIAIEHSDGQNALEGGDLGWLQVGRLPSLFAKEISSMKVGDVSEPIRSPSGFHLIKLIEHRGSNVRHIVTQTHARHILIKTSEITSASDARTKLSQLKERIEDGDEFGELARGHSEDKGSGSKGGDLGWASPGQMVPRFEAAMDRLEPGQISEPFESAFGWHIVQVLKRREHDDSDSFLRNSARKQLLARKSSEEEILWLRQLRDEAYVEIRDR